MKLSTEILPKYFTIASPENSHYTESTNCFDFVDRNSDCLLVTVGESWVWGSELDSRLDQVFGNLVSANFGWDWLNLGQPGASNFYIAERVEELAKIAGDLEYKNITVICVFTEVGRGVDSHHDSHIDYVSWLKDNISDADDFDKFLEMLNRDCVDRILSAADNKFRVIFGSNFVNHLALPVDKTLVLPWFKLLGADCDNNCYSGTNGVKRLQSISQFLTDSKKDLFKSWFVEMVSRAGKTDRVEFSSRPNGKHGHPDADGHQLWANYIIEYFKNHDR